MANAMFFLVVPSGGVHTVTMQFLLPFGHASIALAVDVNVRVAAPKETCFKRSRREEATPYAFAEAVNAATRMNEMVNFIVKISIA